MVVKRGIVHCLIQKELYHDIIVILSIQYITFDVKKTFIQGHGKKLFSVIDNELF